MKVNINRYNKLTKNIKLKETKPLNDKQYNLGKVTGFFRKIIFFIFYLYF
jgi:hypothetical protein